MTAWGRFTKLFPIVLLFTQFILFPSSSLNSSIDIELFGSGFYGPFGLAFDEAGYLFVANEGAGGGGTAVSRISPKGGVSTFATGFDGTSGVAFNSAGVLHVSDDTNRIFRVGGNGEVEVFIDSDSGLQNPNAIAFDEDDNLYVVNAAGFVSKFDSNGTLINLELASGLKTPQAIVVDSMTNALYISDSDGTIFQINKENGNIRLYAKTFVQTEGGLVMDNGGNLYLSAWVENLIVRIDRSDRSVSTCLQGIEYPRGLEFDSLGRLYITSYNEGNIFRAIGCETNGFDNFVKAWGNQFVLNGKYFYFGGTNNNRITEPWVSSNVISEVIDSTANMYMQVIRVWGFNTNPSSSCASPNFGHMDEIINYARSKNIRLIITLTDNWHNFDAGCEIDDFVEDNGGDYHDDFFDFQNSPNIYQAYLNWVEKLVSKYRNEPTILAWELANEPRCAGNDPKLPTSSSCDAQKIVNWAKVAAAHIRQLDPNHLLAVGDEGFFNWPWYSSPDQYYNGNMSSDFEALISLKDIDFGTFHLYPCLWNKNSEWGSQWIIDHILISHAIGKPVLLEEFGYHEYDFPGDNGEAGCVAETRTRNSVYREWASKIIGYQGGGFLFWMLGHPDLWPGCQLGIDPDCDPYWIYYPSDSTADVLAERAYAIRKNNISISSKEQNIFETTVQLEPNEQTSLEYSMIDNQSWSLISANWSGSSVDLSLVEPGGRTINPTVAETDPNIDHLKGQIFEFYLINAPSHGEWQIELYGSELPLGGETVNLRVLSIDNARIYLPLITKP